MSLLMMLLIAWGVLTTLLILLLIYRATLSMHEDEQLFLDDASASLRAEQEEIQKRKSRVTPWVRIFGTLSGVLILIIAVMAVWQNINNG
jgi:hypothetical protein